MGFEGIFNGRIDYQDRNKRRADQTMEFIWSPTRSQGHNDDIWTGILYNHYWYVFIHIIYLFLIKFIYLFK